MRIYRERSWIEKLRGFEKIETKKLGESHLVGLLKYILAVFGRGTLV